ncbi:MAG: metal-sulfur cluster assembly factor [Candidatus Villigracilaceae bacterium]
MSETATNEIKWLIHDTHPDLVQPLRDGLSQVVDPELRLNVIQLGLIRQAEMRDDVLYIKMILTTPFCPYGPAIIELTKEKAQQAVNRPVMIEIGSEPWDLSMLEDPSAFDWGIYA